MLHKANQSDKNIFKFKVNLREPREKLLFTIYFESLSMKALLEQFHYLKRLTSGVNVQNTFTRSNLSAMHMFIFF